MKKIFITFVAITCCVNMSAQIMKILKGGEVVATYTADQADEVVIEKSHEYVDLGLSVKWATCNVGANVPEEYGLYFAWGETIGYGQDTSDGRRFDFTNYKWCSNGSYNGMIKYCTNSQYGKVDNKTILDSEDDAAYANWGGSWRMPTKDELYELYRQCIWTWTTLNGVNGFEVCSRTNGNSIFLPAAGYRTGGGFYDAGSFGDCWSSTYNTPYQENKGDYLLFGESRITPNNFFERSCGLSVRPVCP